jgi:hypothetical protein
MMVWLHRSERLILIEINRTGDTDHSYSERSRRFSWFGVKSNGRRIFDTCVSPPPRQRDEQSAHAAQDRETDIPSKHY